jgi:hypothetical protein
LIVLSNERVTVFAAKSYVASASRRIPVWVALTAFVSTSDIASSRKKSPLRGISGVESARSSCGQVIVTVCLA